MERCPVCRARLRGESNCPRCGAELSLVQHISQAALTHEARALILAAEGEFTQANEAIDQAGKLKKSDLQHHLREFIHQAQPPLTPRDTFEDGWEKISQWVKEKMGREDKF